MSAGAGIPVWRQIEAAPAPRAKREKLETLIVGGGPVGLTAALDLARKGRRVVLINKLDFITAGSKAICFSKRTLDVWTRLGVGDPMVEKGVVWNLGKVFRGDDSDPVYQFDLAPIKHQRRPAFINMQQYHVEEILLDALREMPNVDLRFGHECVGLKQNGECVEAIVRAEGGEYVVETDWLIACDGNKSPVREMMGLDFEGRVFEDNFLIADVKFNKERPVERWFWFDPPFNRGQSALLHKQPDDVWRLDFQLGWNIDREACVRTENVAPYVRGMLGEDVEFTPVWYSVYTFQCRRMARFVHGRVIFAGDSAHLVSPFGARGCNGGVADVDNLVWKLDLVLDGRAPASLLESYNYEAVVTADENILNSTRSTDFLTPKSETSRAFRDAVLELARDFPFARPFVNSGRLSVAVNYPDSPLNAPDEADAEWSGIAPGAPALDAPIRDGWLLDRLGDGFVVLTRGWRGAVEGARVVDVDELGDVEGLIEARYDLQPGGAYLLRPDQYVAGRWRKPNVDAVAAALARAKGRKP